MGKCLDSATNKPEVSTSKIKNCHQYTITWIWRKKAPLSPMVLSQTLGSIKIYLSKALLQLRIPTRTISKILWLKLATNNLWASTPNPNTLPWHQLIWNSTTRATWTVSKTHRLTPKAFRELIMNSRLWTQTVQSDTEAKRKLLPIVQIIPFSNHQISLNEMKGWRGSMSSLNDKVEEKATWETAPCKKAAHIWSKWSKSIQKGKT